MFVDYLSTILLFFVSSILGILINLAYSSYGYDWAKNKNQKIIALLLPPIIFIITKTIAGNLALSLGMVGALSIVRFRNPVKSPLELVIYFIYITIGISTGVNILYAIILTAFVIIIPNILKLNIIKKLTLISENETNNLNYHINLELNFEKENINNLEKLISNLKIVSKFYNKENNLINYVLVTKKNEADELIKNIENENIKILNYNYGIQNDTE